MKSTNSPCAFADAVQTSSKTTALLILIGLLYQRVDMFIDIALAYAMLNFIAVLAASRFFSEAQRAI